MSFFQRAHIDSADSPSVDAFARWRISQPHSLFDAQLTYHLQDLLYEQLVSGTGATVTHDDVNRTGKMAFVATPVGGQAIMQTFEHFRYQPSKSQLFLTTFSFVEAMAGVLKFVGYSDGTNGCEFQLNGTQARWALLSSTQNGNTFVNQNAWSLDKLDGTGPSGETLDITKTQLCVIDIQALYTGRCRVGFDVGGTIVYVHEFLHANTSSFPYLATCNLPIRCGMTVTSGTPTTTMFLTCGSVTSEGGVEDVTGFQFAVEGTKDMPTGQTLHLLSIRPKSTFHGIVNRSKFVLETLDIITGSCPIKWELRLGQPISGTTTFIDANTAQSSTEYNVLGDLNGTAAATIVSGYVSANESLKAPQQAKLAFRYPVCLGAAGDQRLNGTLSLVLTNIGANSTTTAVRVAMGWKEIR